MPANGPARPAEPAGGWPGVSVVVAAKDAASTLDRCLASLRAVDYPVIELLVVDDGSIDATAAIARRHGAGVLASPRPGPSAARNAGTAAAAHAIVAFTDADCAVPPHWLRSLVGALLASGAVGVGGPQRNVFPVEAGESARELDAFFSLASVVAEYTRADREAREVDHNASCNVAYVKEHIVSAGGFAEDLFPGEDVDLDYRLRRLGHRCYYVPDAWVEHHRPGTREWFTRMMRRYGRAQRALVARHGRFRPLHYSPLALSGLVALQLLWLPAGTRPVVLTLDALLAAGALGLLARKVAPGHWGAVLRYALVAVREWHRGYLEGPAGR